MKIAGNWYTFDVRYYVITTIFSQPTYLFLFEIFPGFRWGDVSFKRVLWKFVWWRKETNCINRYELLFHENAYYQDTVSWNQKCNLGQMIVTRSIHQRRSVKKGVLRNFTKFTEKHLRQSLFYEKVAGLGR